jgi:mannonate dehydratase
MAENRRNFIKKGTALAALSVAGLGSTNAGLLASAPGSDSNKASGPQQAKSPKKVSWPVKESADTPKLCLATSFNADVKGMRRIKQIGIDYVLMSGPRIPWKEEDLRACIERFKAQGLTVINMMFSGITNSILGREGRDTEIENVKQTIVAAGKAGVPVLEYNFYVNRLSAGYSNVEGRGGSGYLGYDYSKVKDLPPDPNIGIHTAEELWNNLTYFLKAVIPVAEKAGVRMAMHPNDPPSAISKGSPQIMNNLKGWKRLIETVDSPSNGITFDCGVTREIGEDPLEVLKYFGTRDRINHQHFRNVNMEIPSEKYVEQFVDEGDVNMFAIMQELVRQKYRFGLFPEHPHRLDADKELGGDYIAYVYNTGYARAMLQAVLSL